MALDKRIYDFGAVSQLQNSDEFLVSTSNGTYKISFSALKNLLRAGEAGKVNVYQGTSNYGKILVVNSSGNVTLGDAPTIQPLRVTRNGTYTPSRPVDGYGPIEVDVSGGGGSEWVTYETTVTVVTG